LAPTCRRRARAPSSPVATFWKQHGPRLHGDWAWVLVWGKHPGARCLGHSSLWSGCLWPSRTTSCAGPLVLSSRSQSRRNPTCHRQWHSHGSGSPEAIQTAYHTKCPWSPCGQENAATSQRPDLSLDLSVESFLQ
jgi:hypothetical protein